MFVFDASCPDSFLSLHGLARLEPSSLQLGGLCLDPSPPPRAFAQLDTSFLILFDSRMGLLLLAFAVGQSSSPLLPQSSAWVGPIPVASGVACSESVSVLDLTSLGLFVSAHSFVRPEVGLSVCELMKPEPMLSAKTFSHLEPSVLFTGSVCMEPPLMILQFGQIDVPLLVRAFSCSGILTLLLSVAWLDLFVSSRQLCRLDTSVPVMTCSRPEATPLVFDVCLDSLPFIQSSSHTGVFPSLADFAQLDVLLSLRSLLKLESSSLLMARARVGGAFSVESAVAMDFSASLRSPARLDLALSALSFVHCTLGLTMFLQAMSRLDSTTLAFGVA